MKFIVSTGFIILITYGHFFAQELISNGNFENYNSKILFTDNNIKGLKNWKYFENVYNQPKIITYRQISTVDYYLENNENNPKHGKYVLDLKSEIYKREYIYYQFATPLKKGKYILSFDISKQGADTLYNKLEYLFTQKMPEFKREVVKDGLKIYLPAKNSFAIKHPKYMNTLMPFIHIETEYLASGGEKYLIFGNFNSIKKINSPTLGGGFVLDNISLQPLTVDIQKKDKTAPDTNSVMTLYNIGESVENLDCYLFADTAFGGVNAASLYSEYYNSKKNHCLAKLKPFLKSLLLNTDLSIEITVNKMINGMYHDFMVVWIQNEIASYFEYYGINPDRIILKSYPHNDKQHELEINLKLLNNNFINHKE